MVVSLRDPANTAPLTSRGATVVGEIAGTGFVRVRPAGDPTALVAALQQDHGVLAAALDFGRRTTAVPNDEFYASNQQTYLNLIRMPAAWDVLTDATSQVVAVVDTGVDVSHPDLVGRLAAGFNVVSPGSPMTDEQGHGTFVAGVIAANANNGIGVAGVTWNGRVMPVKVFDGPLAFDSDIATGIVLAVDHGARVINMSLGGAGFSPLLQAAVQYATERNVVVVAAAGNTGSDVPQYPAAFPEVLAVGATDPAGKLVDFSSFGDWLDLAAPGFDIVSTFPGNQYVQRRRHVVLRPDGGRGRRHDPGAEPGPDPGPGGRPAPRRRPGRRTARRRPVLRVRRAGRGPGPGRPVRGRPALPRVSAPANPTTSPDTPPP